MSNWTSPVRIQTTATRTRTHTHVSTYLHAHTCINSSSTKSVSSSKPTFSSTETRECSLCMDASVCARVGMCVERVRVHAHLCLYALADTLQVCAYTRIYAPTYTQRHLSAHTHLYTHARTYLEAQVRAHTHTSCTAALCCPASSSKRRFLTPRTGPNRAALMSRARPGAPSRTGSTPQTARGRQSTTLSPHTPRAAVFCVCVCVCVRVCVCWGMGMGVGVDWVCK